MQKKTPKPSGLAKNKFDCNYLHYDRQLYVPEVMSGSIMDRYHHRTTVKGHPGQTKTIKKLITNCYWPSMVAEIKIDTNPMRFIEDYRDKWLKHDRPVMIGKLPLVAAGTGANGAFGAVVVLVSQKERELTFWTPGGSRRPFLAHVQSHIESNSNPKKKLTGVVTSIAPLDAELVRVAGA
ncbi:hypothetical protein BDK51DRAFT_52042 [Blyttiomyces helicus]|uniref:Integrase zinc-binding domain-containing protein n=1 Tax=Blyttiomyces helicus TaxID=388810 RepID=A0A4P9VTG6_9FUNG|nr:hypothetical protein BDK51DRAFT_52042 [Blyttiomyces helicus]|eukprot:RKO82821.1 hypothetical protein BDK51DRAFT_52042 [Blyttiomyces helicus]